MVKRLKSMNINKKITGYFFSIVLSIGILILVIVSISTGNTIKTKSSEVLMKQLKSLSGIMDINLNNINDMSNHIIADSRIQSFITKNKNKKENYVYDDVFEVLRTYTYSNSYLDYLCVIEYDTNRLVYQGDTWTIPDFQTKVIQDYNRSLKLGYGNKSVSVVKNLFRKDEYALNIYQPIYKINEFNDPSGLLVISIDFEQLVSMYAPDKDMPIDFYLTSSDGTIMCTADTKLLGTQYPFADYITKEMGCFEQDDSMIIYDNISLWDWYIIGRIPESYLLQDTRNTVIVLTVVILVICVLAMFLCLKLSNSVYRPLRDLTDHMSSVSEGDLSTRMREDYTGQDIVMISDGFNHMIKKINELMQQVKEEQHQVEQIQFNALQSQIKPHFLYNALECIHWQAEVDGSPEVSKMVKALATYYRLVLSKGQDVIPLSQELAHVKSYLIIQNMRYDNIIESDFEIDSFFQSIQIPKMTLQPLIENAIYHGIKIKNGRKGKITIRAYEHYNEVMLLVSDNGCGMTQDRIEELNNSISQFDESFGYGIRNVHRRIEIIFGKGYGLHYLKNETGGITVEIKLPKETDIRTKSISQKAEGGTHV